MTLSSSIHEIIKKMGKSKYHAQHNPSTRLFNFYYLCKAYTFHHHHPSHLRGMVLASRDGKRYLRVAFANTSQRALFAHSRESPFKESQLSINVNASADLSYINPEINFPTRHICLPPLINFPEFIKTLRWVVINVASKK